MSTLLSSEGLFLPHPSGLVTTVIELSLLAASTLLVDTFVYGLFRDSVRRNLLRKRLYQPYTGWLWRLDDRLTVDNWWAVSALAVRLLTYALILVIGLSINGQSRQQTSTVPEGSVVLDWEIRFKFDVDQRSGSQIPLPQDYSCQKGSNPIPGALQSKPQHPSTRQGKHCPGTRSSGEEEESGYFLKIIQLPGERHSSSRICFGGGHTLTEEPSGFRGLPISVERFESNDTHSTLCGTKQSVVHTERGVTAHMCAYGIAVHRNASDNLNHGWELTTGNLRYEVDKDRVMDVLIRQLERFEESGGDGMTADFLEVRIYEFSDKFFDQSKDQDIIVRKVVDGTLISRTGLITFCVLIGALLAMVFPAIVSHRKSRDLKDDVTSAIGLSRVWARWMDGWVARDDKARIFSLTSSLGEEENIWIHPVPGSHVRLGNATVSSKDEVGGDSCSEGDERSSQADDVV